MWPWKLTVSDTRRSGACGSCSEGSEGEGVAYIGT